MICKLATGVHHPEVSSDSDMLILVDPLDQELGLLSKDACHDGEGLLHRAFSVFIFNSEGNLLLQKRSEQKRLWPGYWSNSCCSHPRAGEKTSHAVSRRVEQELGLSVVPKFVYKFTYQASFGEVGSEHELCHVFRALTSETPRANRNEVSEWRWISPQALNEELELSPDTFTPWLKLEWPVLLENTNV